MPNLLLTHHCNLDCSYCFAGNSKNPKREEITLELYIYYLKHLRLNDINLVRLLGGEPMLHSKIKNILDIAYRGGFDILVFSNLAFPPKYVEDIFSSFPPSFFPKFTININLNSFDFYKFNQLENIKKNLSFLSSKGANIIVSTMLEMDLDLDYIFSFAGELNIKHVKFKPLNGKEYSKITASREYGKLAFNIIKKYSKDYFITFSCGLSKFIFTQKELDDISNKYNINLLFGCYANGGKYDINVNGEIFRCFPLKRMYSGINLKDHYKNDFDEIVRLLNEQYYTEGNISNCLGKNI